MSDYDKILQSLNNRAIKYFSHTSAARATGKTTAIIDYLKSRLLLGRRDKIVVVLQCPADCFYLLDRLSEETQATADRQSMSIEGGECTVMAVPVIALNRRIRGHQFDMVIMDICKTSYHDIDPATLDACNTKASRVGIVLNTC